MAEPMHIIGSGLVTALGIGVAQNGAHVRAGMAAFAESDFLDQRMKRIIAAVLPADALVAWAGGDSAGLSPRAIEVVSLAGMAVNEALASHAHVTATQPIRTWCAWPEHQTQVPLDVARLGSALTTHVGGRLSVQGAFPGRAGALAALHAAMEALQQGAPCALIVGADSLLQQYVLGTLLLAQRIKTEQHSDGLIPGMGAGALVLARADVVQRLQATTYGRIAGVGIGDEAGHFGNDGDWQGDALAAAAQEALAGDFVPVAEIWSGMTGERCWAGELGVTQVRCQQRILADSTVHHPADGWGDLGAATGVALIATAVAGHQRGWVRLPALVLASSDFGGRGAALLVAPTRVVPTIATPAVVAA